MRKLRSCKFCYSFNIIEGLGLLKLADTMLILINPSPSNVKKIPLGICIWASKIETFITSVIKTVSDTIEENNLDSTEDVTRFYWMEPIQMRSINTKMAPMNLYLLAVNILGPN